MNIYEQVSYTGKEETKALVKEVVDKTYNAVCATLGPNSGLVLINHQNQPTVTKDGANTARALDFNEPRMNMIAELITSAAIRTDDIIGDGTTTTVFMVKKLYERYADILTFGTIRIIDDFIKRTQTYLAEQVTEVTPESDNFRRMIYTTTNHQADIAECVIDLFTKHKSPNVTLIAGAGHPADVVMVQSDIVFEGDYASAHLRPKTVKNLLEFKNCRVLLLDMQLNEAPQTFTTQLMDHVIKHRSPIVVIARSFSSELLAVMTDINREIAKQLSLTPGTLCVIPYGLNAAGTSGGAMFSDIGAIIDIPVYTVLPEEDAVKACLDIVVPELNIDREGVKFNTKDEHVNQKVAEILDTLVPMFEEMSLTEKATVLGKLSQRRIARLRAANVTIIVSGMTDGEISERYFLYEDAVKAAESSLRFGVIPGIGYGLNKAAERFVEDVLHPLEQKTEFTVKEQCTRALAKSFVEVLVAPYYHLTGERYVVSHASYIYHTHTGVFEPCNMLLTEKVKNVYVDLVTGEEEDEPVNVFDNGCAAMCAIESAWSVVKHIGRLEAILGKSNSSYVKK